jgi:hypothetical protein
MRSSSRACAVVTRHTAPLAAAAARGTHLHALHGLQMAADVHLVGEEQYGLRGRRQRVVRCEDAGKQAAAGACACLGLGVRMLQQPVKLLLIAAE